MISIKLNEGELRRIYLEKIEASLEEIEKELIFWDRKELERRTCMCWSTIQKEFLFDPDFPKYKIGAKWYFPAKEAQVFLLNWIKSKNY